MSSKPPVISVVVAVYNGKATLQQCLDSVTQQTYSGVELVVIDGGSSDGTTDILLANAEHIAYRISEPDRGIYNAWNKGLAQAHGEWICFLGADDFFWDAQVLERMAAQLMLVPVNIQVAYGQIMLLNSAGAELYPIGQPWEVVKERIKQVMCIPHPAVMHRRSLFEQHGNFDESFRIAGDYEFLLREVTTADAVFFPNFITVGMRQGGISSNPKSALLTMRETRRAQQMHGQHFPGRLWMMAMLRVYIRLLLSNVIGAKLANKAIDLCMRSSRTRSF